jgi:hypothetical protein
VRGTVRIRLLVLAVASVALVGVGVSPASAAPVADQTQTIPSGSSAGIGYVNTAVPVRDYDLGSYFTAGLSGSLTRIDIPIFGYNRAGTPLDAQVQVWNVDGSGQPIGAALATQVIPEATLAALGSGTLSTAFLAPASVTAGNKYGFTFSFVVPPVPGPYNSTLGMYIGTPAADKAAIFNQGSPPAPPAWSSSLSTGIGFTTYVDATPPAPPAPPAPGLAKTGFDAQPYLLLAGGLLGLGVIAFGISSALRRRKA